MQGLSRVGDPAICKNMQKLGDGTHEPGEGDGREMRVDRCGVLCGGGDRLRVCLMMVGVSQRLLCMDRAVYDRAVYDKSLSEGMMRELKGIV